MIVETKSSPGARSLAEMMSQVETARTKLDKPCPKFGEHMRSLALVVAQYKESVDVMVQHNPVGTALVWGSIRTLLVVSGWSSRRLSIGPVY